MADLSLLSAAVRRPEERREREIETLTEIASLYYADHATQEDLSRRFGMSRAKIGRLLKQARAEGIVEIRVRPHPGVVAELEEAFVRRFAIEKLIVTADHWDPAVQRSTLGGLVAAFVDRVLRDGMTVAVGMGRNLAAVAEWSGSADPRAVTFVSAIGGSSRADPAMNSDHVCRRLAARFGGESETLYAPARAGTAAIWAALMQNETVRETLDRARRADLALVGIGEIGEHGKMAQRGWFTPEELAAARRAGAVGDMTGYDFFDIDGRLSEQPPPQRIIGLTTNELRRIPNVVVMASESSKVAGILGALRTGVVQTLATSLGNAQAVLRMDQGG